METVTLNRQESSLPRWTLEEDQAFVDLLDGYVLQEKLTLRKSIRMVSEQLGRSVASCEFRWWTSIKKYLPEDGELLVTIKQNNPANKNRA